MQQQLGILGNISAFAGIQSKTERQLVINTFLRNVLRFPQEHYFWKVPRILPFALVVRAACRWRVWSIGGIVLKGENQSTLLDDWLTVHCSISLVDLQLDVQNFYLFTYNTFITWTLRAMDQKNLESFEMWCWRRMEKISWTDYVRNEDVLLRVKEQRNIIHEIRKRKANWIGHILRRNCLLQRVTEGKIQEGIEVTGRQGRRRRKLLDDLKERRGYSHLKEEALDRSMRRARFGKGFGPVVGQTTK